MVYIRRLFKEPTLVHFPVGLFSAWLTAKTPPAGLMLSSGFLVYQVLEDWRIKDKGYKDVFGFLIGYGLMGAILAVTGGSGLGRDIALYRMCHHIAEPGKMICRTKCRISAATT